MDDLVRGLIGGMLVFALIAAVVAVYLAFCAAITALATAFSTVVSLGAGVRAFTLTLWRGWRWRGGDRAHPRSPEPAFEAYLLGPVLRDFGYALRCASAALNGQFKRISSWSSDNLGMWTWCLGVGGFIGATLGWLVAAALGAIAVVVAAVGIGAVFVVAWVFALALRATEAVAMRIRGSKYDCPTCHSRMRLPIYVCPGCGAEHERLLPGRYGLLHRRCACGEVELPTLQRNGRQSVPALCENRHAIASPIGLLTNLPVPIAGGPSSGKSTFLAGALLELERLEAARKLGLAVIDESRAQFEAITTPLREGRAPMKTHEDNPPALVAEIAAAGRPQALYAFDVAGEVYGTTEKMRALGYLQRALGLVLLVDPFSIPHVALRHARELERCADVVQPSAEEPDQVLGRVVATLRERGLAKLDKLPIAVVIGKTDAFGLADEIDSAGGPREWLARNGGANLVQALEQQFGTVGWFACSALGRMPAPDDRRPFRPRGAIEPLLWVLRHRGVDVGPVRQENGTVTQRLKLAGEGPLPGCRRVPPRPAGDIGAMPPPSWEPELGWGLASSTVVAGIGALAVAFAGGLGGEGGLAEARPESRAWRTVAVKKTRSGHRGLVLERVVVRPGRVRRLVFELQYSRYPNAKIRVFRRRGSRVTSRSVRVRSSRVVVRLRTGRYRVRATGARFRVAIQLRRGG